MEIKKTVKTASVTRADIEAAAAKVFRREGYRAATMRQIADEVGLHKTSLYHHIQTKQELLVSITHHVLLGPIRNLEAIAQDKTKDPRTRLYEAVFFYMGCVFDRTDAIAVFDLYVSDIEDDELRANVMKMKRRYIRIFVDLVTECLGDDTSERADLVAFAILGACSYVVTWYQPNYKVPQKELAHAFARNAMRAIDGLPVSYSEEEGVTSAPYHQSAKASQPAARSVASSRRANS